MACTLLGTDFLPEAGDLAFAAAPAPAPAAAGFVGVDAAVGCAFLAESDLPLGGLEFEREVEAEEEEEEEAGLEALGFCFLA